MNPARWTLDSGRASAAALAATLLLGAALRLAGVDWGLPSAAHPGYSYHPDEAPLVIWADWLAQGHLIPKHFIFGGTLHYSFLLGCIHGGDVLAPVLGGINPLANAILLGRLLSVGFALLTIFMLYAAGRRLFGTATGLLAALLLAIAPAHVVLVQNVRPDSLATLAGVLALYLSARILGGTPARDHRLFALAGLLIGAAVALRFPLAVFALLPVAAVALRDRPAGTREVAGVLLGPRTWGAAVAGIIAYAVASPHSLIHADVLLDGLRVTWRYESGTFADAVGRGPGLYQYGWLTMREALGTPLYLLALAGFASAAVARAPAGLLVIVAIVPYFILMTFASWVVVRYTMPLLPMALLLAAALLTDVARRSRGWRAASAVLAAPVLAWTLLADAAFLKVQTGRNPRVAAVDWLQANAPAGSTVLTVWQYRGDVYLNPAIPPDYERHVFELVEGSDPSLLLQGGDFQYVVLNESVYRNMERLGAAHPLAETHRLQQVLQEGFTLVHEVKTPASAWGIDFSGGFTSQDYAIVNPGIRIYRRR